jgi:predicted metal-binding membrane protein
VTAHRIGLGSALLGVVVLAWALVLRQTDGMMAAGIWPYLSLWVVMTVAMMLPSAAPMLLLVDRLSGSTATPLFATGYLIAWAVFGAAAYWLGSLVAWPATGALLIAAGIYQALPLKHACLRRCRNPLGFLRDHAGEGPLRVGVIHGAYCVGCCAGLMVVLLALGMMNVVWMALVGVAILAEKLLPRGERLAPISALVLVGFGAWITLT